MFIGDTFPVPFILSCPILSVLHKELEYKVEKQKNCKKVEGHVAEDQSQIRTTGVGK